MSSAAASQPHAVNLSCGHHDHDIGADYEYAFVYLPFFLPVCILSVCLFICSFVCLSVCPSVSLFVCLFFYLPVYLSVYYLSSVPSLFAIDQRIFRRRSDFNLDGEREKRRRSMARNSREHSVARRRLRKTNSEPNVEGVGVVCPRRKKNLEILGYLYFNSAAKKPLAHVFRFKETCR